RFALWSQSKMAQRVRIPHRGQSPSSVTQLPITDSTSREVSYSVAIMIHRNKKNVNRFLQILGKGVFTPGKHGKNPDFL
ncbi:MAG: hypothetical protein IKU57_00840, partial [Oscillospiraceae bacterium]|nr:hypothetical protein [Oscillospiraceae bacterium]